VPPRPSWEGFLKFNLISVPVKGYNAAAGGGGQIGFHLLHKKCRSRIRYKKVCPVHGEVSNDEIVSGYEFAKGQYAIVENEERRGLKSEDDKAIAIAAFVPPRVVDAIYYSGRSYYLLPDGKVGQKPYAVLLEAMREQDRIAVAEVVFSGKAHVAVVRPSGKLLVLSLLSFASEVKKPAVFEAELDTPPVTEEERQLAGTLVAAATTEELDLGRFKDEYAERLAKLVEGKARRVKRAAGPASQEPAVINLMDALRQSLQSARKGHPGPRRPARKPARKKTG
jgi:DNA end-binding protein Ku